MTKDPLEWLTDYGGHVYDEAYQISIDTEDARKAISDCARQEAIGFAEWIGQDDNPFIASATKGKWIQSCGNSTEWTTARLYELYISERASFKNKTTL